MHHHLPGTSSLSTVLYPDIVCNDASPDVRCGRIGSTTIGCHSPLHVASQDASGAAINTWRRWVVAKLRLDCGSNVDATGGGVLPATLVADCLRAA